MESQKRLEPKPVGGCPGRYKSSGFNVGKGRQGNPFFSLLSTSKIGKLRGYTETQNNAQKIKESE